MYCTSREYKYIFMTIFLILVNSLMFYIMIVFNIFHLTQLGLDTLSPSQDTIYGCISFSEFDLYEFLWAAQLINDCCFEKFPQWFLMHWNWYFVCWWHFFVAGSSRVYDIVWDKCSHAKFYSKHFTPSCCWSTKPEPFFQYNDSVFQEYQIPLWMSEVLYSGIFNTGNRTLVYLTMKFLILLRQLLYIQG